MRRNFLTALPLVALTLALYALPSEYFYAWRLGLHGLCARAVEAAGTGGAASDELAELRERLAQKDAELALLRLRLSETAAFREAFPRLRFAAANVVFRGCDQQGDTGTLDRGAADGVRAGDAVARGGALVGKVSRVGKYAAHATFISSPASLVPCVAITPRGEYQPARESCAVAGRGRGEVTVIFYASTVAAKSGSSVLTSGLLGEMPPGLAVGVLAEDPKPGPEANTQVARLLPAAPPREAESVLVVNREQLPAE